MTVDMDYIDRDSMYEHLQEILGGFQDRVFEDYCFKKVDQLFCMMKEKLNDEEFEILRKLRNEEVKALNDFETNFYAGTGCFDYVWVEKNGKKDYKF